MCRVIRTSSTMHRHCRIIRHFKHYMVGLERLHEFSVPDYKFPFVNFCNQSRMASFLRRCDWKLTAMGNCYCRSYCSNEEKTFQTEVKHKNILQGVITSKTKQILDTEKKLRVTGKTLLKDIRDTKDKMKEKMEEVIERENIWTIPNVLCVTRILLSPYLGYLIIESQFGIALGIFVYAGVTDMLDGWIARNFKDQSSKLGSFLDPMADKVLVGTLFVTLTFTGLIPVPLTSLIILRDLLLMSAGFYIRYLSLPPPNRRSKFQMLGNPQRTLNRYFNMTLPTAQLAPTFISKVNTAVQLTLVGTTLAAPVFCYVDHPVLQGLCWLTAATTVVSGLSYVFSKNTYHIIKKTPKN